MNAQGGSINSLKSITLELPPSCIEFCPAHPDYFVVGTYNLQKEECSGRDRDDTAAAEEENHDNDDEDDDGGGAPRQQAKQPQSRNGSLLLFSLEEADISHVQTVPYPSAILDLHFSPHRGKDDVMAVVSSTGTLSFFELAPPSEGGPATLKEVAMHRPLGQGEGVLLLSCAWHPSLPGLLAITTSNYEVHVLRVDETWGVSKAREEPVITHTLEAWTVAFSPPSTRHPDADSQDSTESRSLVVYSGGDDSKLLRAACVYKPSQTAVDDEVLATPYPTTTVKGHEAGVTAILPLPLQLADGSEIVVTGSYDDRLRVYRVYTSKGGLMTQRPSTLADENLGGGVWRLKLIRLGETGSETSGGAGPSDGKCGWAALILASCMHAGCRVVELRGDYEGSSCDVAVLARFEEHKSMNYGSDFQPGSEQMIAQGGGAGGSGLRCVSTSFYDRLLCLWHFSAVRGPPR